MAPNEPSASSATAGKPLLVISMDSHVGAEVSQYRPYCEARYLDRFEQFLAEIDQHLLGATMNVQTETSERRERYLAKIAEYGGHDLNADAELRVKNLDADGIVVDTVFHGGFNFQPIPFFGTGLTDTFSQDIPPPGEARELREAGIRMYNRWLADWVSIAPERFVGVAHVPVWDIDATIAEVEAASDAGLRGVNLPSPRREILGYNQADWYPLWELCCDRGLALHTHGGAGDVFPSSGPGAFSLRLVEMPMAARRAMSQMILGQVFEEYRDLKLILTEQMGTWIVDALEMLDSAYYNSMSHREVPYIQDVLPRPPSDYFRDNVFVGASFMSRREAETAIEKDYWQNMMWGRDFPHPEGTWPFTIESLRGTFAGLPEDAVRGMVGENAARALGLDVSQLRPIADEIGPMLDQINEPLAERPEGSDVSLGFRKIGYWS